MQIMRGHQLNLNARSMGTSWRHLLPALVVVLLLLGGGVQAAVPCTVDSDCHELQGPESACNVTGPGGGKVCSNPFLSGCLYQRLPGWDQKRVCNSEDSPETIKGGFCEPPQFDYMEVRMTSGNWESITFNAWVLQIVLSELLGVPTTLEPGQPSTRINFYDEWASVEYGVINNTAGFANARKYTDCRRANRDPQRYEPCMNLIPEFWSATGPWAKESVSDGSMESPQALGVLAQETLFIPKFTAQRDSTLISYIGMQGEENRQKLADAFLRPTLWNDYCQQVSNTSCAEPDEYAMRAPKDTEEGDAYYSKGLYTGYFRKTQANIGNATHPPVGHLIDYPCDWTSYAEQQLYHLNIALSGDVHGKDKRGYGDMYLPQILEAANATKSNIMIMWALPDPFYQRWIGTDMELHAVVFPPVTMECLKYKRSWEDLCSADWALRVGDPRGACEEPPNSLHKAMSTSLTKDFNDPSKTLAERSPAVDTIKQYTVSAPIYGSWFDLLIERNALEIQRTTLMRDATCQWVVDNFDLVKQWVPFSYPRTIKEAKANDVLEIFSIALSGLAILCVVLASLLVYSSRHRRVMVFAQVEFLLLLLIGLLCMSFGSLAAAMHPTTASCISAIWLVNVGYTIELAPLLTKVSAINRLMTASDRMQKITIARSRLYGFALIITLFVVIFLIVWTALDAPEEEGELSLSTSMTEKNETIVYRTYYCTSKSDAWQYAAFGWTFLLLFITSILAFEMRNVRQEFNESQTLVMMTYSHFVFSVLRLAVHFIHDLSESDKANYASILLSVDAMAALTIYFLPKFIALRSPDAREPSFRGISGSSDQSNTFLTRRESGPNVASAALRENSLDVPFSNDNETVLENGAKESLVLGQKPEKYGRKNCGSVEY